MKCSLAISNFLEEISSLSLSTVFLYFFVLFNKKAFSSFLVILYNSALSWVYISITPLLFTSLLASAICKAPSDNHFTLLHFFFFGMVLVTTSIQCDEPPSIVLQAGDCLPEDLIPSICLSLLLYNHKEFDLGST